MRYIDTHAHLNLPAFAADVAAVVATCHQAEVAVINVGTTATTSATATALAAMHEQLYAIVGLHPIQTVPNREGDAGEAATLVPGEVFAAAYYRDLARSTKVVGIGECGFDYWHCAPDTYAVQEAAFLAQIALANELQLPLMIHTRGPKPGELSPTGRSVYADVYELLHRHATVPFTVHFYAGTYEEAVRFIEIGGQLSFTGVVTFASVYADLVRALPLSVIHAETDCPYVAPVPYRGRRCEPWMVTEVYKKIAAIRGEAEEAVRLQLLQNAATLYRL